MTGSTVLKRLTNATTIGKERAALPHVVRKFNALVEKMEQHAINTGSGSYMFRAYEWGDMSSELIELLEKEGITVQLLRTNRDHDIYMLSW